MPLPPPNKTPHRAEHLFDREWATWFNSVYTDLQFVRNNFVLAMSATMYASQSTAFPDLGTGWEKLEVFDTVANTPRYIVPNTTDDTMTMQYAGLYEHTIVINLTHNDLNAGRQCYLRITNADTLESSSPVIIGTASNTAVTNVTIVFSYEISNPGHSYYLEIGNGDTYTDVTIQQCYWNIKNIGEWKE